jgi:uncharacterized membrane protein YcaP (DUF421 family)
MFILLIRTALLYLLVVFTMRIMGKRQIGQLQPYELVIAIMISDLASMPMQDTRIPLLHGIIPIITLLILQVIISILEIKSDIFRNIMDGKPNVVIKNGKFEIPVLRSQIFSVNDLMEELRIKGYFNIDEIEYAILETNGELSIIPRSELEPATKKDLNLESSKPVLPVLLISDGRLIEKNLKIINKDEKWFFEQLSQNEINSVENIFIAYLSTNNKLIYQYKCDSKEDKGDIEL